MTARQDIAGLLEAWRQLSVAEGVAIQSADWPAVRQIQSAKTDLKESLNAARQHWRSENPHGADAAVYFQMELGRLISLEVRNAELVAAQQKRAAGQRANIKEAQRNLHKIGRSYLPQRVGAAWNYYS